MEPLMAGHHQQPLPLPFLFNPFSFQTSGQPGHHHRRLFHKNLSGRLFFKNQLTLDLASLLYKCMGVCFKQQVVSCVVEVDFLPHLFLLDPVVGNLFNCFLELLFRGNPAQTFLLQENNNRTITGKNYKEDSYVFSTIGLAEF